MLNNSYRTALLLAIVLGLACFTGCRFHRSSGAAEEAAVVDSLPPLGFWEDSLDVVEGEVRNGETFSGLMVRLGMDDADAYVLASRLDTVFDVRKMRAGNHWHAYYRVDSTMHRLEYVVYENDRVHRTVFRCADSLAVWRVTKPVERQLKYADITIRTSLWNDMVAAGAPAYLISQLAEVYAWTVDFFGLQKDDRFRVVYSQMVCEGEVIDVDTLYYAVYSPASGKEIPAIMFDQGDGGNIYWNDRGESLRKAFLKAPLKFTRISSGFSYHRKHPVTGVVKPHTAVDYAAPTGTPVMSIGDGTVLSAGWGGGGGNTVKIRHNSVYTTAYLHLSRYAKGIRAGARVRQGDVIGYVGATGTATGPHLDFRVWKNGTPVNPLTLESPPSDPIRPENRAALDSVCLAYRALADSLTNL